ncbi:MAG TPA: class I SAM-dependent methyltransferase [Bacteroidia bacterium]|nr:class I SAM-dependent methyltransferase [Bacteroidia bacterium]
MVPYKSTPLHPVETAGGTIDSFISGTINADSPTVKSFGDEWNRFSSFTEEEIQRAGEQYFDIVTEEMVNKDTVALDIGCGSGRWSKFLSPRVKFIEAVDPGEAVHAAVTLTKNCGNIRITQAGYRNIPFEKGSFGFVFSLGVVHHLPDTAGAVQEAASLVKKNGWLLLYIYYNLDNRGALYRLLFGLSSVMRRIISRFPRGLKFFVCELIAIFVYGPFVLCARFLKLFGGHSWKKIPLSYYADKPWKVIRNDSLDRFGTPLEKRFSREEIEKMLLDAGMDDIRFSENEPYWHVVSRKK